MNPQHLLFAEVTPEEAGRVTGQLLVCVILLAGILKCASISRRPTTNRKCVLALLSILAAWMSAGLVSSINTWVEPSAIRAVAAALLGLAMFALIILAIILAILGLAELSRQPGTFTQGRSQAIWALVLGGIMFLIAGGGFVAGILRARGFASLPGNTKPGQTTTFEDLNFRFEAPGSGWVSYDARKFNKDSKVSFLRRMPEAYFLIIAERLGPNTEFSSRDLAELGKARLQAGANSVRVISEEPYHLNGLNGLLVRTDASVMAHELHYLHWYIATNGFAFQLVGYGPQKETLKVDAEIKKMFAHFSLLDPKQIASTPSISFRTNFTSTHYHYWVRTTNSAWGPWTTIKETAPSAEFGAASGDSCFLVTPAWLGGEKVDATALAAGFLTLLAIQYPDEKLTHRKVVTEGDAEGLQFDFERELQGNLFHYRFRILQRAGDGYLFAAWTQRKRDFDSILDDALERVNFLPVPISSNAVPRGYTVREHKTQGIVLNQAGLFHFNAGEYERALPLFCAAARANSQDTIYVLNALQCWSHLDRPREALDFLKSQPAATLEVPNVRAWQAHLQNAANLTQDALQNYSNLFAHGFRSEGPFTEYIRLLASERRLDEAQTAIDTYLRKEDSLAARLLQAEILTLKKDFPKAISLLKEQHESAPFNLQVSKALAETCLQAGLFNDALQVGRELTQNSGDRALGFYLKGRSELGLRWFREAKASFEAASKLAPANPDIISYLDHVSGLLGEGSNSSIKDPIDPVPVPAELTNSLVTVAADYAKDHGAYYSRRLVAVSWKPGKEYTTTEFLTGNIIDASGLATFSTVQIPFDPLYEQLYVNELRVSDRTGKTLAIGKPSDYYLLDDNSHREATQKKILNIPIPGLEPGARIDLTITSRELGHLNEFPFLAHCFSRHLPVRESLVYLRGETSGLKYRCSPALEPERLADGLCWRLADPTVAKWEPMQPPAASFLPMLWIADASARWSALATNYLADIRDRMELDAELLAQTRQLVSTCGTDEAKIVALTRHVQTNFSYKAIEFGRRARIPNKPSEIVRNKYGDCKDHALLLQQMLRAIDIPAQLALVSHQSLVQQDLPSLDQFDHMIVFVPGKTDRFIDCTDKGADAPHAIPLGLAGRQALILDPQNPRFLSIPEYPSNASRMEIARRLRIVNAADLTVDETLTLTGVHAAYMRAFLLQLPPASRRTLFQRQMGLADAELVDFDPQPLDVPDQPLRIHCSYTLKKHFHATTARLTGVLRADFERGYLAAEPVERRQTPFEVTIPTDYKSSVSIQVPDGFQPEQVSLPQPKLDRRFVSAECRSRVEAGHLNIEFECHPAIGKFQPSDYPAYRDSMAQALALLEKEVSFTSTQN